MSVVGVRHRLSTVATRLDRVRATPRTRRAAQALGAILGLVVAWMTWHGFVLGGALVALFEPDWKRGLLAGLAFGALAWAGFAAGLVLAGTAGKYAAMGQIFYLSAAIPIAGSVLGSLVRLIR